MQQVRLGVVLLGEGQSAISDGAGVAHGISLQRNRTGDSSARDRIRSREKVRPRIAPRPAAVPAYIRPNSIRFQLLSYLSLLSNV
jgi:hypothetical protein